MISKARSYQVAATNEKARHKKLEWGDAFGFDIIARYRILSTQNEGGLAGLPVRHPLGALEGGLRGGCFGNSCVSIGRASKGTSYHSFVEKQYVRASDLCRN